MISSKKQQSLLVLARAFLNTHLVGLGAANDLQPEATKLPHALFFLD